MERSKSTVNSCPPILYPEGSWICLMLHTRDNIDCREYVQKINVILIFINIHCEKVPVTTNDINNALLSPISSSNLNINEDFVSFSIVKVVVISFHWFISSKCNENLTDYVLVYMWNEISLWKSGSTIQQLTKTTNIIKTNCT